MFRQAAADGGVGAYLTKPGGSILPEYTAVGGSVLPQYTPVGELEEPVRTGTTEFHEMDRRNQPGDVAPGSEERAAALRSGLLFFTGLALGYIWAGTTGSKT